jgi:hypothetical protein
MHPIAGGGCNEDFLSILGRSDPGCRAQLRSPFLYGGFDQSQPVLVEGTATKVQWQNPHTFFYVDVKDKSGKVVSWVLETGSPNALQMRGWMKDSIKPGDRLVVHGYRAKDGSNLAAARSVTLADGRTIFGGQTDDGGPSQ